MSRLRTALLTLHIAVSIPLIMSYGASSIEPQRFPFLPLIGMAYPYLVILQLLFGLLWLMLKKRYALFSLVFILIGWPRPMQMLSLHAGEYTGEDGIELLSYNIRLFNKYGWEPDTATGEHVFEFIASRNADILCFQEFYHIENIPEYRSIPRIKSEANAPYFMFEGRRKYDSHNRERYFGLATFSKYPIVDEGTIIRKNLGKARAIYTDIALPGDTVRVYNVHLKSLGFRHDEYAFINDALNHTPEERYEQSKGIFTKLTDAFIERAHEANLLKAHMKDSPYPVIVMGDFNEVPYTRAYAIISENMQDGFVEKGLGRGTTYGDFGTMPAIRIDYILADSDFEFLSFKNYRIDLSDHEPVTAKLKLK
jgi:endonuclease/exonuclease/phosphatase family metal-dependent hydrolase